MWTIDEMRGLDALDQLAPEWQALLDAWPGHTLFQTFAWCRTFACHTAGDSAVVILRLRENGNACGLIPLAMRELRRGGLRVRRLEWLGAGPADRLSWLLPPGLSESAVTTIVDHILQRLAGWDVWDLRGLMAEAPGASVLFAQLQERPVPQLCWGPESLPVLHIAEPWEAYQQRRFKSGDRARIEQLWRKLTARGRISVRFPEQPAEVAGLTARLCQLPHRAEGYGAEFQIPFAIPRLRTFMDALTTEAAAAGWLRAALLDLDGALIAYRYDFEYRGEAYGYFAGFDPAHADCGPGRLLLTDYMATCFARGVTRFHFLRGSESYKGAWTEDNEHNLAAVVFRPTLTGRVLRAAYRWRARGGR